MNEKWNVKIKDLTPPHDVASKLDDFRRKFRGGQDWREPIGPEAPGEDHAKVIEDLISSSKNSTTKENGADNTTDKS